MADREEIEAAIRRRCDGQDWSAAATAALRGYGPEVLGFLHAALGEADAREAFSLWSESLWRGLPGLRWESSFRTWAYALARAAVGRVLREPSRRGRLVRLSQVPEALERAESERTVTRPHLRTDVKTRVRHLRDALEPDDQMILTLRVDRGMSWRDIALVIGGPDGGAVDLTRRSALLRKRFERLKGRLRALIEVEHD